MQNARKETPPTKADRYRRMAAVLARHGIGAAFEEQRAVHIREACEELGTTFIKLGQMLSMRADLLPADVRAELAKLRDDVPPVEYAGIESVIVEELGASPELVFTSFDKVPLACASIAQAHLARLSGGRTVVVKVQKPGVREEVEADLQILRDHAHAWTERFPVLADFDFPRLVEDFAASLRDELDFRKEAGNVKAFNEIFERDSAFDLPQCVDELCTERVLTLTRVPSEKKQSVPADAKALADAVSRFVLEPAFVDGVFYADPHPGNVFAGPDGRLCVVDFGMVGRLSPQARRHVADVFVAIDRRDSQRLADRVIDLTSPSRPIDRASLTGDIERMLDEYIDASLQSVDIGAAIGALLDVIRQYKLRLPGNLAQLFKALIMCEGLLETVDPDASFSEHLEPVVSKAIRERLTGGNWQERIGDSAADAAELSMELPRRLDRVLGELERGNLRVWTRVQDAEELMVRLERTVERANASMLAAACIVAIAIVLTIYHPQGWHQWIGVVFWVAVAAVLAHVVRTLLAMRR